MYSQHAILVQSEEELLLAMDCAALLGVSALPLKVFKAGHENVSNARSVGQIR